MRHRLFVLLVLAVLASCAPPEPREEQTSRCLVPSRSYNRDCEVYIERQPGERHARLWAPRHVIDGLTDWVAGITAVYEEEGYVQFWIDPRYDWEGVERQIVSCENICPGGPRWGWIIIEEGK